MKVLLRFFSKRNHDDAGVLIFLFQFKVLIFFSLIHFIIYYKKKRIKRERQS